MIFTLTEAISQSIAREAFKVGFINVNYGEDFIHLANDEHDFYVTVLTPEQWKKVKTPDKAKNIKQLKG